MTRRPWTRAASWRLRFWLTLLADVAFRLAIVAALLWVARHGYHL